MLERLFGSLFQRHMLEATAAKAAKNAADIEFIAMMTDVEMESDQEDDSHEEVEEI